jgi:hypothetical protein
MDSIRKAGTLVLVAALFAALGSAAGCSKSEDSGPPAALNPAPPIRAAFVVSLQATASEISQYEALNGGQPPQGDGVGVLFAAGLRSAPQEDPWGREVRYHGEGGSYRLESAGPDGRWGTPDDIVIVDGQRR